MARKNLLKDLLAPLPEPQGAGAGAAPPALPDPAPARTGRGPIGAVSRGIADLRARAVLDLDPFLIDAGGVTDRLEHDEADHARLLTSLRDHGQQVGQHEPTDLRVVRGGAPDARSPVFHPRTPVPMTP